MLNCNKLNGVYVHISYPKLKCWEGTHILHSVLAILVLVIFTAISMTVALFGFEPKIDPTYPYSRKNARGTFFCLMEKILLSVIFTFLINMSKWILAFSLFLSTLLLYLYIRKTQAFYRQFTNFFLDLLNSMVLWANVILILVMILDHFQFKQGLMLIIVTAPFALSLFWPRRAYCSALKYKVQSCDSSEGLQLINDILSLAVRKDYFSMIMLKKIMCAHIGDCKKCTIKFDTSITDPTKFTTHIILLIKCFYKTLLRRFPRNPRYILQYALYQISFFNSQSLAFDLLQSINSENLDLDEQFVVYRYSKLYSEERNSDAIRLVAIKSNELLIKNNICNSAKYKLLLFRCFKAPIINLNEVSYIGEKLNKELSYVQERWRLIEEYKEVSQSLFKLYHLFLSKVMDSPEMANDLGKEVIVKNSIGKYSANIKTKVELGDPFILFLDKGNGIWKALNYNKEMQSYSGYVTFKKCNIANIFPYLKFQINLQLNCCGVVETFLIMPNSYCKFTRIKIEWRFNQIEGNIYEISVMKSNQANPIGTGYIIVDEALCIKSITHEISTIAGISQNGAYKKHIKSLSDDIFKDVDALFIKEKECQVYQKELKLEKPKAHNSAEQCLIKKKSKKRNEMPISQIKAMCQIYKIYDENNKNTVLRYIRVSPKISFKENSIGYGAEPLKSSFTFEYSDKSGRFQRVPSSYLKELSNAFPYNQNKSSNNEFTFDLKNLMEKRDKLVANKIKYQATIITKVFNNKGKFVVAVEKHSDSDILTQSQLPSVSRTAIKEGINKIKLPTTLYILGLLSIILLVVTALSVLLEGSLYRKSIQERQKNLFWLCTAFKIPQYINYITYQLKDRLLFGASEDFQNYINILENATRILQMGSYLNGLYITMNYSAVRSENFSVSLALQQYLSSIRSVYKSTNLSLSNAFEYFVYVNGISSMQIQLNNALESLYITFSSAFPYGFRMTMKVFVVPAATLCSLMVYLLYKVKIYSVNLLRYFSQIQKKDLALMIESIENFIYEKSNVSTANAHTDIQRDKSKFHEYNEKRKGSLTNIAKLIIYFLVYLSILTTNFYIENYSDSSYKRALHTLHDYAGVLNMYTYIPVYMKEITSPDPNIASVIPYKTSDILNHMIDLTSSYIKQLNEGYYMLNEVIKKKKTLEKGFCSEALLESQCNQININKFGVSMLLTDCNEAIANANYQSQAQTVYYMSHLISYSMEQLFDTFNTSMASYFRVSLTLQAGVTTVEIILMILLFLIIAITEFVRSKNRIEVSKKLITLIPIQIMQNSSYIRNALGV